MCDLSEIGKNSLYFRYYTWDQRGPAASVQKSLDLMETLADIYIKTVVGDPVLSQKSSYNSRFMNRSAALHMQTGYYATPTIGDASLLHRSFVEWLRFNDLLDFNVSLVKTTETHSSAATMYQVLKNEKLTYLLMSLGIDE